MGRWSRPVAERFLLWLAQKPGSRWLDVGCGTGVLSGSILAQGGPSFVAGLDFSPQFVAYALKRFAGERAAFFVGDAGSLPFVSGHFDAAVSAIALNFFPQPGTAVGEMARVVRPGGQVAVYVWDYAEGMEMLRFFWDTAVALDAAAGELDEGRRFPLCRPEPLVGLFEGAGLSDVRVEAIEVQTRFDDFEDYWRPLLGGVGPVPGCIAGLDADARRALKEGLCDRLPVTREGSINLTARAWAVRGFV